MTANVIIAYTRQLNQLGGVITWDVPIGTTGRIPQPFIDQFRAIGKVVTTLLLATPSPGG